MKKLAIIGSGSEEIVKHFDGKDIEITCFEDIPDAETVGEFDLTALINFDDEINEKVIDNGRFINLHPSLLPSFEGKDAVRKAFTFGVKVSGVTIHWVANKFKGNKIIAQYPVLIGNAAHYDEFEKEINNVGNILYPRVIEAILDDKVFDFSDLFKGGCNSKGCGGCGGCH